MEENLKILEVLLIHAENTLLDEETIALKHLIKGYRELEEFKKQVTEIESTNFIKYKNYISKSKIKEIIEELEKEKEEYYSQYKIDELNDKIQVLQELMEDK